MSEMRCDRCDRVIGEDGDYFAVSWRPHGSYLYAVDVDLCSSECLAAAAVGAARAETPEPSKTEPTEPKRKWWQR